MRRSMSRTMSKLALGSDLSTVQEDFSTLTRSSPTSAPPLKKQHFLSKYSEPTFNNSMSIDFSDYDDNNDDEELDFQERLRNRTPHLSKRQESLSSISSSRTPSKFSETSESSDHSDYNDDFIDSGKVDLISNFKQHNQRQQKMAALEIKKHQEQQQFQKSNRSPTQRYYPIISPPTYDDDFDPIDDINFSKLNVMERKKSMPLIQHHKSTASSSPIKRVTKYASTLDLNNKQQSKFIDEFDQIDDLTTEDLTITYEDYQKLKRKSQRRIDLSKYKEEPSILHKKPSSRSSRYHRQQKTQQQQQQQQQQLSSSNFDRLTRQGKLKVITVMNKPNSKRTMKGHLYGEIVYDPLKMKWTGNEEELNKFNSINNQSQLLPKSSTPQRIGNMVYDDQKLRWVSINGKYDDDPFDDDTIDQIIPPYQQKAPTSIPAQVPIQNIQLKRSKIVPSSSSMSLSNNLDSHHFKVTTEMYKHWKHEEVRWVRKVGNWFNDNNDELDDISIVRYELKSFLNKQ